jgi:hypothetical protein
VPWYGLLTNPIGWGVNIRNVNLALYVKGITTREGTCFCSWASPSVR